VRPIIPAAQLCCAKEQELMTSTKFVHIRGQWFAAICVSFPVINTLSNYNLLLGIKARVNHFYFQLHVWIAVAKRRDYAVPTSCSDIGLAQINSQLDQGTVPQDSISNLPLVKIQATAHVHQRLDVTWSITVNSKR